MSTLVGSALPPITLAIPYYSQEELLLTTVRSIALQTHPKVRVLVCDDSPQGLSAKASAALSHCIGERFALRIVRNERNLGMARTWNRCLDEAETDLVTLVHGDDELAPDYATQMAELARKYPRAVAMFSGATVIDQRGRPTFSFPDYYKNFLIPAHDDELLLEADRGLRSILKGNYIFCPSLCYRRSVLGPRRFDPRYKMVLDIELTTTLLLEGELLVGVPRKRLYRYRRHAENATQHLTKDLTRFREEAAYFARTALSARARGFSASARVAARMRILKLNLLYCIVSDARFRRWSDAAEKMSLLNHLVFGELS